MWWLLARVLPLKTAAGAVVLVLGLQLVGIDVIGMLLDVVGVDSLLREAGNVFDFGLGDWQLL